MNTGAELWKLFIEDGVKRATRVEAGLVAEEREAAAPGPSRIATFERLAHDAYAIATEAMLMGMEELAQLALACETGLTALSAARVPRETLLRPLADAALEVSQAFEVLAHPDASGARLDPAPLEKARLVLLGVLGEAPGGEAAPIEEPSAEAGPAAAPDDDVWKPTVDADMVDMFVDEANERLEALAGKLVALEDRPEDGELIREIFRDLHTIKGSSGMVGLVAMNRLAHAAEDLVGQLRDGARRAERPVVDALLAALDGLREILGRAVNRARLDLALDPILRRLKNPTAATSAADLLTPPPAPISELRPAATEPVAARPEAPRGPQKQTLRVDFDKLDLLLNLVGELVLAKTGLGAGIQGLGALGHELAADRRLARRVVVGGGPRRIAPAARPARPTPPTPPTPDGEPRAKETLRQLGEEIGRVERVFLELTQDLAISSDRLDHVSAELRDQVMKLRMIPIAGIFRKYHRTVRDLSHALGKQVRLELEGEETELDKMLVEQLDDPLMHLVRNAIDHGIEASAARVAAGKDPEGVLRLRAYHRGNTIVIEIADDGGGIATGRLKAKAREKELATAEELEAMDDKQALELIFRPGFSTAAAVTDVSGRGVGMDVVRDAIVSKLKGSIDVASTVGQGTTFTLRLPLTLAVLQVLLLRAGGEVFAVPLDVVMRTLTCAPDDIRIVYDREVLAVQGKQVPLVRVRDVLELGGDEDRSLEHVYVILVEVWGQQFGLVCERLLGKQEVVIKSLGHLLEDVPCAAGATLLGERCALILNVPEIVQRAIRGGTGVRRAAGAAGSPPPVSPAEAGAPAAAVRVLLVEDSDLVRESLKRLLQGAGYHVTEARDGAEALSLCESQDFDLISTDVMMPHVDGYELTRRLRAGTRFRDTPIIMVTSRGEKIDRVRGFDAGVDEYITKPHDRQELLRALARLLKKGGA